MHSKIHRGAYELRAVVAVDSLRQTAFARHALERGDDVAAAESMSDVHGEQLARRKIQGS